MSGLTVTMMAGLFNLDLWVSACGFVGSVF